MLLLFLFDFFRLFVFCYQREEAVSEFLIVDQDPILDGREVFENGLEAFMSELIWEGELQDVVKLCAGHVPIAVSVNFFDAFRTEDGAPWKLTMRSCLACLMDSMRRRKLSTSCLPSISINGYARSQYILPASVM